MSTRTVPEIQQEYQNLCIKAGHLQYQIYTYEKDVEMINKELRDLNLEAAASKAAEAKASEEAAAKAAADAATAAATPAPDNVVPITAPAETTPAPETAAT